MTPHSNPISVERRAKAPYNFIPLPEKVVLAQPLPSHDSYDDPSNRHTGRIVCELETKTPIYTRALLTPELFKKLQDAPQQERATEDARSQIAQFYSYKNQAEPMIPGSTIRGMLRSMVEIITYSKVTWVTEQKLIFRAVGDRTSLGDEYRSKLLGNGQGGRNVLNYPNPNVKGGYLQKRSGAWFIQPAEEHLGETFVHVDYSITGPLTHSYGKHKVYDVYVLPAQRSVSPRSSHGGGDLNLLMAITSGLVLKGPNVQVPAGYVPGKLIETGQMGKYSPQDQHSKHMHCVIYAPDKNVPEDKWWRIPDELWAMYSEDVKIPREKKNTPRELKDGEPLFYLVENETLVFFGPTMMFRLPYPRSPYDFIPENIKSPEEIDMAEAIFGYIRQKKPDSNFPKQYAGRVRVTDATFCKADNQLWVADHPITPKILSNPKPTTFQHYLEQTNPEDKKALRHYATAEMDTRIRGSKQYWHKAGFDFKDSQEQSDVEDWEADTQHTQIMPVNSGVHFTFTVFFENLSSEELGALFWAVSPPGSEDYCQKIGMAKPLGYGSVKIHAKLYLENRQHRYRNLFSVNQWDDAAQITTQDFIEDFEKFMKSELELQNSFRSETRIRMLLAMLTYPGPQKSATKYQELKEFRDRPVLPDPLYILEPERPKAVISGTTQGEISVGMFVTARIIDNSEPTGDLWASINGYDEEKYIGQIKKANNTKDKKYREEMTVRCTVLEIKPEGDVYIVSLKVSPRK